MKTTTRRDLVKGLAFGALIVGFDPSNRSWVTSAEAGSAAKLDHLPHLDGVLRRDDEALTAASEDYGRFIHRKPVARARTWLRAGHSEGRALREQA
jgi:hypothetical protein